MKKTGYFMSGIAAGVFALVLLVALMVGWSFIEVRLLLTTRSTVTSPNIPPELDGMRIAFASDIHAGDLLGEKRVVRIVDTILAEKPDLILLGGDSVGGGERGSEMFYRQAKRLDAPLGVISVLGNHEAYWGKEIAREGLRDADILLLENEHARVLRNGATIQIAGVEDLLTGETSIPASARDIAKDSFAILISHNPDALPGGLKATKGAFDLALSGHTHGGQVTVFGLSAPFIPSIYGQRFRGGWTSVEGVPVLVSRGAGVWAVPVRFFAPPEVHIIQLHRGKASVRD